MSSVVKCYIFVNTCSQHPLFYCLICYRRRVYILKNKVIIICSISKQFGSLRSYVQIFLTTCFFCLNINRVNSPCFWTSDHFRRKISLRLRPVRHEKRNALFMLGYSHFTCASCYISSTVKYIRVVSGSLIPTTPLIGLIRIILSLKAIFRQARSLLK